MGLTDGSNPWIDPGYRRADLHRNTCAVNSANSAVVDVAAFSALGVQTGQPISHIEGEAPTARNDAFRVGSGQAHVRAQLLRREIGVVHKDGPGQILTPKVISSTNTSST